MLAFWIHSSQDPWSTEPLSHESCSSSRRISLRFSWFQSAEHSQTQPPPHTWFHVGFLDLQVSVSVIHGAAKGTNRVFLAGGLVWDQENPIFYSAEHSQTQSPPHIWFHVGFLDLQYSGSVIASSSPHPISGSMLAPWIHSSQDPWSTEPMKPRIMFF